MDISLRGELWDNDSADVLRFWGSCVEFFGVFTFGVIDAHTSLYI